MKSTVAGSKIISLYMVSGLTIWKSRGVQTSGADTEHSGDYIFHLALKYHGIPQKGL